MIPEIHFIPPYYRIELFPDGSVKVFSNFNKSKEREMKQSLDAGGYLTVGLSEFKFIHAIVAFLTYGKRPEGLQVNHIDGNKLNNRPSNLEYCTRLENVRHSVRMGLRNSGIKKRHSTKHAKTLGIKNYIYYGTI